MTRRGAWAGLLAVAMLLGGPLGVARSQPVAVGPDSPACVVREEPPTVGLDLVDSTRTGRLLELTLSSEAMRGERRFGQPGIQRVSVLLPEDFDATGETRYPVLYLLHGLTGSHWSYLSPVEEGGQAIEDVVGDRDVIVVFPDGGYSGWYSDWYGAVPGAPGHDEPSAWETYHLRELVPFVDGHLPTVGTREGRAIAGVSMGGFGAMSYAARHPDLFAVAGSVSGVVNTTQSGQLAYPTVDFLALNAPSLAPDAGPPSHCKWGDPYTQQVVWEAHNPTYLAANLRGVELWLSSGDGTDPDDPNAYDPTEAAIRQMNVWFTAALDRAGVPYTNTFRPGTHTAPFWDADLRAFMPWLMERLARPTAAPAEFSLRSASASFGAWGWTFDTTKVVEEFTYVDDISRDGFTITGSGRVRVETPAAYIPGARYVVDGLGGDPFLLEPGSDKRLEFQVDLGPPHQVQQYRFRCGCWNDLDEDSGIVDVLGDDPELRSTWVQRSVTIRRASHGRAEARS